MRETGGMLHVFKCRLKKTYLINITGLDSFWGAVWKTILDNKKERDPEIGIPVILFKVTL